MKSLFEITLFLSIIFLTFGLDLFHKESNNAFTHSYKYLQTDFHTSEFKFLSVKKKSKESLNYHPFLCQAKDQSQSWSHSIARRMHKLESLLLQNLRNKTEAQHASSLAKQNKNECFSEKTGQNMSKIYSFEFQIVIIFILTTFCQSSLRKSIITITRRYNFLIRLAYVFSVNLLANVNIKFLSKIKDQPEIMKAMKEDAMITLNRIRQQMSWSMYKLEYEYQNEMEFIYDIEIPVDDE